MDPLTFLILLFISSIAICFIFITAKKPFWGIIFVMIVHFWFGSIEANVYPRILSIIFVGLIIFPTLAIKNKIKFDLSTRNLLVIALAIFLWEIFVNQVIHRQSFDVFISTTAKVLIPIILGALIYLVISNEKLFNKYLSILFILISISALVGIFQFFEISWAWILREVQGPVLLKPQPSGLALYALHFSYQLGYTLPLVFSFVMRRGWSRKKNYFYQIILILIIVALFMTKVRSAILGGLIGMIFTLLIIKKYKKGLIVFLMLTILITVLFSFIEPIKLEKLTTFSDQSATARIPLFITALYIAKDNLLFGIGSGRVSEVVDNYYASIFEMRNAQIVFSTTSHNQFLNVLVYFGVPGLLLSLFFYFVLFKRIMMVYKASFDKHYYYLSAGFLGSFVSYLINSFFHNTGPFISDPYNWFIIGATFVLFKLHEGNKP